MSEKPPELKKRYRLTMEFDVWCNDEILDYDEGELDDLEDDEKQQLLAQRSLLRAILQNRYNVLEELLRKRVLEEAESDVDDLKETLLLRNISEELMLERVIDTLPHNDRLFLLEAIEEDEFEKKAGDAIYSIGVEMVGSSLTEIDEPEEEEY